MKDAETIRREFEVCCTTVEVLHRTSTVGRSKAPSLPIKALSFCRPTELRAERWYAVPKGDETAGLGGFLGLTGPMGRRVLKFDGAFGPEGCGGGFAAGCVEGLHRFAQGATAASPLRVADCRSAAMLIKSALRDWLSVSYGMIGILRIGSLRSPPPIRLRRTSPRESVSHDSQVALLPYESCSLATPMQGAE